MVKVILSRKGFDSSSGGNASPVFRDKFITFPIPRSESGLFYKDMQFEDGVSYLDVMKDLGIRQYSECHLDPDLLYNVLPIRPKNWRPIFGQSGNAEATLRNEGIEAGDIFLFYGWFKNITNNNGRYSYKSKKGFHAIFGYLEVEDVIKLDNEKIAVPAFAESHYHVKYRHEYKNKKNSIYISNRELSFDQEKPGSGCFYYRDKLKLTREGEAKSRWKLPGFFREVQNGFKQKVTPVSEYNDDDFLFNFTGRGSQETFSSDDIRVVEWAKYLIKDSKVHG